MNKQICKILLFNIVLLFSCTSLSNSKFVKIILTSDSFTGTLSNSFVFVCQKPYHKQNINNSVLWRYISDTIRFDKNNEIELLAVGKDYRLLDRRDSFFLMSAGSILLQDSTKLELATYRLNKYIFKDDTLCFYISIDSIMLHKRYSE